MRADHLGTDYWIAYIVVPSFACVLYFFHRRSLLLHTTPGPDFCFVFFTLLTCYYFFLDLCAFCASVLMVCCSYGSFLLAFWPRPHLGSWVCNRTENVLTWLKDQNPKYCIIRDLEM